MTDRHSGYFVTLETDIREDDASEILSAIRMIKGVLTVDPHIGNPSDQIAIARVKREMSEKIISIVLER
ncbi:hypothetical protein [Ensifer sp. SL37]|uniref:hypothetical protein n=1 Tax=Ensifer sp. SL37 TaxID=2995137 RepID=UPI0022733F03|nr:hypothetical protein [Ensifer sp. SL37]MCY1741181.1 hypothetical protein [Ensifer sp. SL37]